MRGGCGRRETAARGVAARRLDRDRRTARDLAERDPDEDEHDAQADHEGSDAERDDRREERGTQERRVHDRGAALVVLRELGVGLAVAHLERVLVDDLGLRVGGERTADVGPREERRIVGHRDVLGRQLRGHDTPGDTTRDDHDDPCDDAEESDDSYALRGPNRDSAGHCGIPPRAGPLVST
ncbi:hypothetical protein D3C74_370970 [compost metagenome]